MDEDKHFPAYFPELCPPDDATSAEQEVYRLCDTEIVNKNDFDSYYIKNPDKYKNNILAYGVSVYLSKQDCDIAKRKSPNLRHKKFCAYGITYIWTGKSKQTSSKNNLLHYTW